MKAKLFLLLGALASFLAVGLGAFAAHGLKEILEPARIETFHTAVDYQAWHAMALILVGLLQRALGDHPLLRSAGWCFVIGIVLFSGSLYLLVLTNTNWLGAITPLGGLAFLAAWFCLALYALKS